MCILRLRSVLCASFGRPDPRQRASEIRHHILCVGVFEGGRAEESRPVNGFFLHYQVTNLPTREALLCPLTLARKAFLLLLKVMNDGE